MASEAGDAPIESYREASLVLAGVVERQQRALELQLLAARELSEAVKEASAIISTLLVGDPSAALSLPSAHAEGQSTSASDDPRQTGTPRAGQPNPEQMGDT